MSCSRSLTVARQAPYASVAARDGCPASSRQRFSTAQCGKLRTIGAGTGAYGRGMERIFTETVAEERTRPSAFERGLCAIDGKEGSYAAVRQAAALVGP